MAKGKIVAIIGAGPIGLAAAAHAVERGLQPVVLEQGPSIGHAVRQWAHVPMFSPWAFNIDAAAGRLLAAGGWSRPSAEQYPTGGDLVSRYLAPLAECAPLREAIRLGAQVLSVSRVGLDKVRTEGRAATPFALRYRQDMDEDCIIADAVIDASGTWFSPNPAGAGGMPAIGEAEAKAHLSYGMPDLLGAARDRYAGKRVAVLGGGHSAIGSLIALADLKAAVPDTEIVWLYRGLAVAKAFGGGAADQLAARGELGTAIAALVAKGRILVEPGFQLSHVERTSRGLRLTSAAARLRSAEVDELVVATGFRPDLAILRELRVALDPALECPPALAPLIDPNIHSCGTVRPHGAAELAHPEPGFYIAGMKSYGRAPTFLLATGHEQVRSIVAELAGDVAAARRVELALPATGVCSSTSGGSGTTDASCCGSAPAKSDACCALDAQAKAAGEAGCGCDADATRRDVRETIEA